MLQRKWLPFWLLLAFGSAFFAFYLQRQLVTDDLIRRQLLEMGMAEQVIEQMVASTAKTKDQFVWVATCITYIGLVFNAFIVVQAIGFFFGRDLPKSPLFALFTISHLLIFIGIVIKFMMMRGDTGYSILQAEFYMPFSLADIIVVPEKSGKYGVLSGLNVFKFGSALVWAVLIDAFTDLPPKIARSILFTYLAWIIAVNGFLLLMIR